MELVNVEINNYRSIEKLKLNFEKDTKVFIGVSETGKSNLLKALNVINPQYVFNPKDVRENIGLNDTSKITYMIKLTDEERKKIITFLKEKFPYIDLDKTFISNSDKKYLPLSTFFEGFFSYKVDIENEEQAIDLIFSWKNITLDSNIKSFSLNYNEAIKIIRKLDNYEIVLKDEHYINQQLYSLQLENKLKEVSLADLIHDITNIATLFVMENFNINVLYWNYSEHNLLPAEIKTSEFINNPDICLPLKKIFELAGKSDIKKEYEKCQQRKRNTAWRNLLDDVNKKINIYIKGKWSSIPDNTKIILAENGDYITIEIKDYKNGYEMSDRSDGYKRLMTFLIMISIDNKLSKLKNALILIDSPDLEIDIPSQKYLKNELIEIGKNNYVFYSTHSPYMIDNDNISRHYIVSKKNEITKIEQAEESKAYDNTIMLNALGTTLFENVNNTNIAFEGFTDKKLLDCGKELLDKSDLEKINNVGRCQFGGLKNLNSFVGIWELVCKMKKCIVCIDDDTSAKEKLKSYFNNDLEDVCEIISYSKYVNNRKVETAEDFLNAGYIKAICDDFSIKHNPDILISESKLVDDSKSNMDIINAWLGKFKFETGELNQRRSELKRMLFNNIKVNNIRSDYKDFLTGFINDFL